MKKLSSLALSLSIHIFLIIATTMLYISVEKKLEAAEMKNKKSLCINLKNYRPTRGTPQKVVTKKSKKKKRKKKKRKYVKKKEIHRQNLLESKKEKKQPKNSFQSTHKEMKQSNVQKVKQPQRKCLQNQRNRSIKQITQPAMQTNEQNQSSVYVKREEIDYSIKYLSEHSNKIRELISKNLYYPRKARKRHLQGTVRIMFSLTASGKVNTIEVVSSNSRLLSNAAISTIRNIQDKIPTPSENITITVPIVYKLIE